MKGKIRRGGFFHLIIFCPWFRLGANSFVQVLTTFPTPFRKRTGLLLFAETCLFSVPDIVFGCLRHAICLRHDRFHTIYLRYDMFRFAER